MKIEHIGITVKNPFEMAEWYVKNLGFEIKRQNGTADNGMVFISDKNGTIIEIIKAPGLKSTCDLLESSTQLHIAFKSDNPYEDSKKLQKCGAEFVGECPVKVGADILLMMKDPWGNTIQLAKRGKGNEIDK